MCVCVGWVAQTLWTISPSTGTLGPLHHIGTMSAMVYQTFMETNAVTRKYNSYMYYSQFAEFGPIIISLLQGD